MNIKQKIILKKLAQFNGMKFSELLQGFSYEDKFPYHLKRLLLNKFIAKRKALYFITKKGLAEAITFDSDYNDLRYKLPQALFVCQHEDKYLIREHFYNHPTKEKVFGLPNMAGIFGQKLEQSAYAKLCEKYLIKGKLKFKAVQNYFECSTEHDLIFDNIFLIFDVKVTEVLGTPEGCKWLTKPEIISLPKLHSSTQDFILSSRVKVFSEREVFEDYVVDKFDA